MSSGYLMASCGTGCCASWPRKLFACKMFVISKEIKPFESFNSLHLLMNGFILLQTLTRTGCYHVRAKLWTNLIRLESTPYSNFIRTCHLERRLALT